MHSEFYRTFKNHMSSRCIQNVTKHMQQIQMLHEIVSAASAELFTTETFHDCGRIAGSSSSHVRIYCLSHLYNRNLNITWVLYCWSDKIRHLKASLWTLRTFSKFFIFPTLNNEKIMNISLNNEHNLLHSYSSYWPWTDMLMFSCLSLVWDCNATKYKIEIIIVSEARCFMEYYINPQ